MERTIHIIVTGRVQGVGFRFFTEAVARRLGIAGWVRNRPGGDVEIVARVDATAEVAFLAEIRRGPGGSRVDDVRAGPAREETDCPREGFTIRH